MEKINTINELEDLIKNVSDKHIKGYMYDSLVYRYMRAREKMADYEWQLDKSREKSFYQSHANRDIAKFCQILDEAIGEHD